MYRLKTDAGGGGGVVQFVLPMLSWALEVKREICRGVSAVYTLTVKLKHTVRLVLWNIPDFSTKTHPLGILHHHCGQTQNTGRLREAASCL